MKSPRTWTRNARRTIARVQSFRMTRVPDAPALPVRDPWPGDPGRGASLLRGELEWNGLTCPLNRGSWGTATTSVPLRAVLHGFTWLRDLRALGTDAARTRARVLVADWITTPREDPVAGQAYVTGARLAAWLAQYDFFAASADDAFRARLMARLVADARHLSAMLPTEERDARALTALKGLVAAAVALPDHAVFLSRALRFLPQEIARQVLPDGCNAERSPAVQIAVLQDLTEMRALLQAAQIMPPQALSAAIERMAPALRSMRHGDGGVALFNGAGEENSALIELVLTQAGRTGRAPAGLTESGFHRLQAGRSVLLLDGGAPPGPGLDATAHAGTLSFELSIGRDRMVVNCGHLISLGQTWNEALRSTAAHSTLAVANSSSSEVRPRGLGRRPAKVEVQRQEANGAHWVEASHDGYLAPFGAVHRRRLYLAESGEDIRGEDVLEAQEGQNYALRFHLHPGVVATLSEGGADVQLRLPANGTWRMRADGATLTLEDSVYVGTGEPREAKQVVLTGTADGPQHVKWAITKVG